MELKVVQLNADYGNNVKGDKCAFPAHIADRLCAKRIETPNGDQPGAVYLEKETKAHAEWLKNQAVLKEAEVRQYQAAQMAALGLSSVKR